MARHVCGTCRFFQATATNEKTGWCSHPEKQTTTDVRILVRAGELYCRNDWDHSLWQPAESGDLVLQVTMTNATPSPERPASPRPIDIAAASTPAPMRSVSSSLGSSRPLDDDPPLRQTSPNESNADEARLVSEDLNRELLRKAREQYRLRRKSPRLDESPAADRPIRKIADPIIISNDVHTQVLGAPSPKPLLGESRHNDPIVPQALEGAAREIERDVEPPAPERDHRSVERPEHAGEGNVRGPEERSSRWSFRRGEDRRAQPEPVAYTFDDVEVDGPPAWAESEAVDPLELAEADNRRLGVNAPGEWDEPATRDWDRDEQYANGESADQWSGRVDWRDDTVANLEGAPADLPAYDESPRPEPRRSNDRHDGRDLEELAPWDEAPRRRVRLPAGDVTDQSPPTVAASVLWESVPRCCATCRDFRPAENGERGWCTNNWAFKHRRMVDVNDVACETTIGAWWLPRDDVWQDEYDIATHGQSTPLMDRWLGRRGSSHTRDDGHEVYRARRHS